MSSWRSGRRLLAGTMAILSILSSSVFAQETAPPTTTPADLTLELNTANDVEGGCRVAFVAYNGTQTTLDALGYEVVVFDAGQRIAQILTFEFGALPQRKTKIGQFDIANLKCADISRLIINSASRCEAGGAALALCLDAVKPTSRTPIALSL